MTRENFRGSRLFLKRVERECGGEGKGERGERRRRMEEMNETLRTWIHRQDEERDNEIKMREEEEEEKTVGFLG